MFVSNYVVCLYQQIRNNMENLVVTFDLREGSPSFPVIERIIQKCGCEVVAYWSKPNRYEVSSDSVENLFELGTKLSIYVI